MEQSVCSGDERWAIEETTSTNIARLLVSAGVRAGLDRSALAGISGLEVLGEPRMRIPTASVLRTWEELSLPLREFGSGGTRLTEPWRPGALGTWDYLFVAADTLAGAFADAGRHFDTLADARDRIDAELDDSGLAVTYSGPYQDHPEYQRIAEFVISLLLMEGGAGLGTPLTPISVRIPGRAPARHRHLIEAYRTRSIDFGATHPSVTFSAADADRPLPRADPALAAILREHARLEVVSARPVFCWLDRFRAELDAAFASGATDLARVAARMRLGPRTVQRRLREEGTSWRVELERARRQRVDRLLRETSLTVESIAARVGYTDPRALRRAVHRWYGHGPAEVRGRVTRTVR